MKRRDAVQAIGAVAMAPFAAGNAANLNVDDVKSQHTSLPQDLQLGNAHFLSRTNPTATTDQRDLEMQGLEVLQMPLIQQAKVLAGQRFKVLAGPDIPAEALQGFDDKMEEWAYHYVLLALNSDPNYPKVLGHDYGPPHEWFGMKLPGGRGPGTGENVDNHYSVLPIDPNARYELHGQRFSPAIGDSPLHLVTCLSMGMNAVSFDSRDIQHNVEGSFVITIDNMPANGRRNHMQATADTRYLFIRDGRIDWNQIPNAYRIHRLGKPSAPPLTLQQKVEMASRFIVDDVAMNFFFSKMVRALPVNTVAPPASSNLFGGQPLQKLARGHLTLDEDEAYVLTVTPGGSQYHVLVLYDYWLMSGDYWSRTSAMNSTQSIANPDGSHTYVFSIRDPGLHNWIDTLGLRSPSFLIRFQLLPRNPDGSYGGTSATTGQLVKLKDLESVLPVGTRWVTPEQRKQQLAERLAAFNRRYTV